MALQDLISMQVKKDESITDVLLGAQDHVGPRSVKKLINFRTNLLPDTHFFPNAGGTDLK